MGDPFFHVAGLKTELEGSVATVRAIDDIELHISRGETFAIVGESGCGKSMTALSILRLLPESGSVVAGSVALNELELLALPEAAMRNVRGRRIAMIFQEPATSLNPVMTVGEQIREVLERHDIAQGAAADRRVRELIDAVGIPDPEHRIGQYPFQLSGGLKQRVMIAMALAAEPDLLVADEPTTALDVTIQAQVLELLRRLQRDKGMSILLITHDLGIVAQMAHQVAVMYAGQLVEVAERDDFFAVPRHPYSRKLFAALPDLSKRGGALAVIPGQVPALTQTFAGCRFADRCDFAFDRCHVEVPGMTAVSPLHRVRCHLVEEQRDAAARGADQPGSASGETAAPDGSSLGALLEVSDLKVHFPIRKGVLRRTVGSVKAVDGVSLAIAPGRTLALVGESGCGKTTVGKAILQLIRPTAGSVVFEGADLVKLSGAALRKRRGAFQIVFQDPYASLNPRMRVADILAEGMAALGVEPDQGKREQRVIELLAQVGLPAEARDRYPHEFSGGQRQRVAIARALAVNPKLIICDEPTSALDVSVQAQILNLMKRLQQELGLSYLFITHNIAVVAYLAHQVAVMYLGRIVERGSVAEVLGAPKHPYTRALLAAVPRIEAHGLDRSVAGGAGELGEPELRVQGELPSSVNPPSGCHFHPRCPDVMPRCKTHYPGATAIGESRQVHCWLYADPPAG
ncbi:MAG: ABC transporter ATP-binding protein [Betaproteobacteria bacterium]|nr:ABC transporter ATP-binding protein [Betaproteobacteria bacterium]